MALTRANADTILLRRVAGLMDKAGIDSDGSAGTLTLGDGLAWALRMLGYTPASYTTVVDGDLDDVASSSIDALLDLAELRVLESISTMYASVTSKVGPLEERLSDLAGSIQALLVRKRAMVSAMHGHLLAYPLDETADTTIVLRSV
jgi:hypothetical protein